MAGVLSGFFHQAFISTRVATGSSSMQQKFREDLIIIQFIPDVISDT
jgi:hypothetical protein